jgi:hypothetical protein
LWLTSPITYDHRLYSVVVVGEGGFTLKWHESIGRRMTKHMRASILDPKVAHTTPSNNKVEVTLFFATSTGDDVNDYGVILSLGTDWPAVVENRAKMIQINEMLEVEEQYRHIARTVSVILPLIVATSHSHVAMCFG